MTTDLEKQFFDTFGIEPRQTCKVTSTCNNFVNYNDCNGCNSYKYPEITDRILLELICLLSEWRMYLHSDYTIKANDTLNLKVDVLKDCLELIEWYEFKNCEKDIKPQVQSLFKEG